MSKNFASVDRSHVLFKDLPRNLPLIIANNLFFFSVDNFNFTTILKFKRNSTSFSLFRDKSHLDTEIESRINRY